VLHISDERLGGALIMFLAGVGVTRKDSWLDSVPTDDLFIHTDSKTGLDTPEREFSE
jgi:hypothetical protein